jgi:hypothetical protein
MKTIAIVTWALVAAFGLAGCSEQPQELRAKKTGAPSWQGTGTAYAEPGWNPGDQKSWETQMRNRAQRGQDEYTRTGGPAS